MRARVFRLFAVNLITLARLFVGAATPALFFAGRPDPFLAAAFVFILISDLVDGALARYFGVTTRLGSIFDYVTDRFNFWIQTFLLIICGVPIYVFAIYLLRDLVYVFCQVYIDADRIQGTKAMSLVGTAATYLYVLYLNTGSPSLPSLNIILALAYAMSLANLIHRCYRVRDTLLVTLKRDLMLDELR